MSVDPPPVVETPATQNCLAPAHVTPHSCRIVISPLTSTPEGRPNYLGLLISGLQEPEEPGMLSRGGHLFTWSRQSSGIQSNPSALATRQAPFTSVSCRSGQGGRLGEVTFQSWICAAKNRSILRESRVGRRGYGCWGQKLDTPEHYHYEAILIRPRHPAW